MNNHPCTDCGYVIHHDEECPGCTREYMDAQLSEVQAKLDALRTAAELFRCRVGLGVGFQARHEFENALKESR